MKESVKKAIYKYREKTEQISVRFGVNEKDLYDFVSAHGNKAQFVKKLIQNEMEKEQKNEVHSKG